jgi:hypothetical protein
VGLNKYIILLGILIVHAGCKSKNEVELLVDQLLKKDDPPIYQQFRQYGKNAIPYLIDAIDEEEEKGFFGFLDTEQSRIFPLGENYVGIKAAYMIEYILADTNNIRIYRYGIIAKTVTDSSGMEKLSLKDMPIIKGVYQKWWKKYKEQPLSTLTKNWRKNRRPLPKGAYHWE